MFAPLNGAPLNGGAYTGGWATGVAHALADSAGDARLLAYAEGVAEGTSASSGAAFRLVTVSPAPIAASSESAAAAARLAGAAGQSLAVAQVSGLLLRYAAVEASLDGLALSSGVALRNTSVAAVDAVGEATTVVSPELVAVRLRTRPIRGVGQTWVAESLTTVRRIRQRYMSAAAVARSRSRALPNTRIGTSTILATGRTEHDPSSMRVYQSARGIAICEVDGITVPGKITKVNIGKSGVAEVHLSPTITRDGQRFSYFYAITRAEAQQRCAALSITTAPATALQAQAVPTLGVCYQVHKTRGAAQGRAFLPAVPNARVRVNSWRRVTGVGAARAHSSAGIRRYRWVPAEGALDARASVSLAATRLGVMTAPPVEAYAETTCVAWRNKTAESAAIGEAVVSAAADLLRRPFLAPLLARASSQAQGLRRVILTEIPPAIGETRFRPVVFKINAGAPAPGSRTIIVPPSDRELVLAAPDREYLVT